MTKRLGLEMTKEKKERTKKKKKEKKEDEIWVIEANERPFYITPESEDFKRMAKEPDFQSAFAGGGKVIRYFNEGGGVYGYSHGVSEENKHQGQYDIQVKKIKGKGKVL